MRQARELHLMRDRLIIELPEKPNIRPKEYIKVPITPELEDIQPYRSGLEEVNRPKAQEGWQILFEEGEKILKSLNFLGKLAELGRIWYQRLGHPGLKILIKTS